MDVIEALQVYYTAKGDHDVVEASKTPEQREKDTKRTIQLAKTRIAKRLQGWD
jgi:hypothetical protein